MLSLVFARSACYTPAMDAAFIRQKYIRLRLHLLSLNESVGTPKNFGGRVITRLRRCERYARCGNFFIPYPLFIFYPLKGSNMAPPVFLEDARQVLGKQVARKLAASVFLEVPGKYLGNAGKIFGKHLEDYPPADPTAEITGLPRFLYRSCLSRVMKLNDEVK